MKKIPFNVNAYAARLIGRENVSKLEGAILELVKNTYDADATICLLYYNNKDKYLLIADNGCGMNEDIIINNWMTIGNSTKVNDFHTEKGRIQTGAKGIGRFALDRISQNCEMYTTTSSGSILWRVDWNTFNHEKNITEITADIDNNSSLNVKKFLKNLNIDEMKEQFISNFNTGTVFKLTNLNDEWNSTIIADIRQGLISLMPANIENEFKIYFLEDGKDLIESEIIPNKIDSYDYKISFNYDNSTVKIFIDRNEFDFGNKFDEVMKKAKFTKQDEEYFCGKSINMDLSISELVPGAEQTVIESLGKFNGEFYFYKNSFTKNDKEKFFYKEIIGRKKYSETFGGIKIYRDNFRIRPYGEAKSSSFDWLLLSNRKSASPAAISHPSGAWRVAAEQMYGNVNISRTNISLPDQSNREGIVETKAFKLLREVLLSIISIFERDRQYVGRKLSDYYKIINPSEVYQAEIINNFSNSKNDDSSLIEKSKAKIVIEEKEDIIQNLTDENKMLMLLATSGIITNSYVHETKTAVHSIGMCLSTAEEALSLDNDKESALKNIEEAIKYKETMNCWYKVTIDSITKDKRTMKSINLYELLEKYVELWRKNLKIQNINIDFAGDNNIKMRCYPYEIESIISNLITNSVAAVTNQRILSINISIKMVNDKIQLIYEDNGKGLSEAYKRNPEKILEAFETDKRNDNGELIGTGMGLWIVNKIVKYYNGTIDLSDNKTRKVGYKIIISF